MADPPVVAILPHTLNVMQLSLLPIFKDNSGQLTFTEFADRITAAATQFNWSAEEKMYALRDRLYGEARQCLLEILTDNLTFDEALTKLKSFFCVQNPISTSLFEFMSFRQSNDMPVERFIAQAEMKARHLNLGEEQRQQLLLSMLKTNIHPEILRGVVARNPQTIAELKELAKCEEEAWKLCRSATNPFLAHSVAQAPVMFSQQKEEVTELSSVCQSLVSQMAVLTEKIAKLEFDREKNSRERNSGERSNSQRRKGKCFRCNREGHYARECYARLNSNPQRPLN